MQFSSINVCIEWYCCWWYR